MKIKYGEITINETNKQIKINKLSEEQIKRLEKNANYCYNKEISLMKITDSERIEFYKLNFVRYNFITLGNIWRWSGKRKCNIEFDSENQIQKIFNSNLSGYYEDAYYNDNYENLNDVIKYEKITKRKKSLIGEIFNRPGQIISEYYKAWIDDGKKLKRKTKSKEKEYEYIFSKDYSIVISDN